MDVNESGLIGYRLRRVREERGQGLRLVAGLAGMSKAHLSRIERGERSPTIDELYALADALKISVAELTRLPLPAPANGHTDSTTNAIGLALDGIEAGHPNGMVLPLAVLRGQVAKIHRQRRACEFKDVATALPSLIRNLHTTLATGGTERAELLDLAVYLHVHVTRMWLVHARAENHLVRRTAFLALRLAQERDEITTLAVGTFGVADVLIASGAFEPSRELLESIELPPITAETAGFAAVVTACHALSAVLQKRPADAVAPMDTAAELAGRFDLDSLGPIPEPHGAGVSRFVFNPVDAATAQIWLALETHEPDRAVTIADGVNPDRHPLPVSRANYWMHYGRALAQLPHRRHDAVTALRTAEQIFPTMVLRDPMVRDTLAGLMNRSIRGAAGEELREMTRRAALRV
jgi:transcriptional regulator with XRE-family HTH domain